MNFNVLCKVFKKETVTAHDVADILFRSIVVGGIFCVLSILLGDIYLTYLDPMYVTEQSIVSIVTSFGVGIICFVVLAIILGTAFYLFVKSLDLIVWIMTKISDHLKTIKLAQCPTKKKP